jgi:hypothetical protein
LTEEYEVIEGAFDVMSDGAWTCLGPGQSTPIPPATLHTFKNRPGAPVRVRNVHRPPARFEDYIEHNDRLMHGHRISTARDPRVSIYLSMLMLEYSDTLAPGRTRERVAINTLARVGQLLRLRTHLPA